MIASSKGCAASIALVLLAACGGETAQSGASAPATPSEPQSAAPSNPTDPGDQPPSADAWRGHELDGGVAWCTAPAPDELKSTTDLTGSAKIRIWAGRCVPPSGYFRACDDAGLPIYVPPCGDEFTGTRLEIGTPDHAQVTFRAHSIDVVEGPMPGQTWAVGPTERAVIVKAQNKVGDSLREDERVIAVVGKEDSWSQPSEEFSEVVAYPKTGTFAFWRKAVCVDPIGCTTARWEASRSGIHLITTEKDVLYHARQSTRAQIPTFRSQNPVCPLPAILGAARIYTYSRMLGDSDRTALAEYDKNVFGLSTTKCAKGETKAMSWIRSELVRGTAKLLGGGGKKGK